MNAFYTVVAGQSTASAKDNVRIQGWKICMTNSNKINVCFGLYSREHTALFWWTILMEMLDLKRKKELTTPIKRLQKIVSVNQHFPLKNLSENQNVLFL